MSRLDFRATLDGPRPNSAVALGATATLGLALSGQLEPWALGGASLGLAAAWALRTRPQPWQHSGLVLNLALGLVAALALSMWLRGAPAIVALAHFAAPTQALQLLDARPRRSEFLLVALALFQVLLAANLTDSLWFPPLLVVFSVTASWTLIVHTLRVEAVEAGQPGEAQRVLTPGLRRTALLASLGSVLLAVLIFPALPRLRSGAFVTAGAGAGQSVSGFSSEVELGDIGRIRLDPTVALRVETLEGTAPPPEAGYWRGVALDHFDGRRWTITASGPVRYRGVPEVGVYVGSARGGERRVQRILREPVQSGVVFAAGRGVHVRGPLGRLERDGNGSLYARPSATRRVEYRMVTDVREPSPEQLRVDRTVPPDGDLRYLALPELSQAVTDLARRIVGEAEGFEAVERLEGHLRSNGRYTDRPPPPSRDGARSPVEDFLLGGMAGHCEYFATGMVVLARSLGIPARLVNGFAGGRRNEIGGFVELTRSDAHSWVEVHYEGAGWVRYDPTPPDLRLAGAAQLSAGDRLAALASALELWWFRNVVEFDRGKQMQALKKGWRAWRRWRGGNGRGPGAPDARPGAPSVMPDARVPLTLGALMAVGLVMRALWRRQRGQGAEAVPAYYAEALRLLARRGHPRAPQVAARDFAASVAPALSPEAARAFRRLTEAYLAERFGGHAPPPLRSSLDHLRESLRRSR